jgi:S-adenosylmethionine-diacylgycerolhomoserine-N-methlytransferase
MTAMATPASAAKMDTIYRRQRFIYDATRRYYLFGRDRLIENLAPPEGGAVLEIGCGTARNLIRAARRYPEANFYGLDVSEEMLRTARASIAQSGFRSRIFVAKGDATDFDGPALFGPNGFDRIFVSYALSMIPDWREVVRQAAASLAPGGKLLILDFGGFEGYPGFLRRAQLAWLSRFSVTPIPAMEHEIGILAGTLGLSAATEKLYGGYAILACLEKR